MGHSLGGMYATYWECKYPDEIEAVVYVDGSICFEIPEEEQADGGIAAVLMPIIEKLGFAPLVVGSEYGRFMDKQPENQREQMIYMMSKTMTVYAAES